ncbi:hypothetical protein Dimus_038657 [Dionaea muscipula]
MFSLIFFYYFSSIFNHSISSILILHLHFFCSSSLIRNTIHQYLISSIHCSMSSILTFIFIFFFSFLSYKKHNPSTFNIFLSLLNVIHPHLHLYFFSSLSYKKHNSSTFNIIPSSLHVINSHLHLHFFFLPSLIRNTIHQYLIFSLHHSMSLILTFIFTFFSSLIKTTIHQYLVVLPQSYLISLWNIMAKNDIPSDESVNQYRRDYTPEFTTHEVSYPMFIYLFILHIRKNLFNYPYVYS